MNLKNGLGFIVTAIFSLSCNAKNISSQENIKPKIYKENDLWQSLKAFHPKKEKAFIIVTPSYNNAGKDEFYKKNLDSICNQNYSNYHIIYIDDASPDGTAACVENYLTKNKKTDLVTLIKNKERQGHMANFYNAIHSCPDDAIIVVVDGDDWLAHKNVLTLLNKVYSKANVWMTYGQFKTYPQNTIGLCRETPALVKKENSFRKCKWIFSHLRTFYAWLFKQIKIEDLCHDGVFFTSACDLAMMIPMLEMAGTRSQFIPDVLTIYNQANVLHIAGTRRAEQKRNAALVRLKPLYKPLLMRPKCIYKTTHK